MESILTLGIFSLAMFLGCYLAGSIPLVLTLSEKVLRRVTVFGAGLLVGTALIVIIPEGIESLYSGATSARVQHNKQSTRDFAEPLKDVSVEEVKEAPAIKDTGTITHVPSVDDTWLNGIGQDEDSLQFLLGCSLVLGFVFMLIIDQLSSGSHSHTSSTDVEGGVVSRPKKGGATVTIGLVVHAAADGLALGAAAGLSKSDVEFVIFLAIMLHKAPAAFGFVSFLIHEGFDKRRARLHLLIFSLASPIAAFFSYFGLVRVMYISQVPITGVTMLFSAGTFLYVATVHVLNEVTSHSSNSSLSLQEVTLTVIGSLLPLLFNIIHSH